ncbi:hypothetical protein OPQ81_004231 [Rhizoctonia solani]|nr:hypothetical protein OPQ81_004231 [Rhizoctonia solani]
MTKNEPLIPSLRDFAIRLAREKVGHSSRLGGLPFTQLGVQWWQLVEYRFSQAIYLGALFTDQSGLANRTVPLRVSLSDTIKKIPRVVND